MITRSQRTTAASAVATEPLAAVGVASALDAVTLGLQRLSIPFTSESPTELDVSDQFHGQTHETLASFKNTVVALANKVYAALGNAQLEATYQRALLVELRKLHEHGVSVAEEVSIDITYDGHVVGHRRADIIVGFADGSHCILELKAVAKGLTAEHLRQLKYYMWSFKVPHGVLINFPRVPDFPDIDDGAVAASFYLHDLQGGTGLSNVNLRKHAATSKPAIYHVFNAAIVPPTSDGSACAKAEGVP